MKELILVTGGGRSGKSRHALELAEPYDKKAFIATAEALDDEMRERIAKHREVRPPSFLTIEEPLDMAGAIRSLPVDVEVAVIDCLTVWLGNLMHRGGAQQTVFPEIDACLEVLKTPACDLILVTNEVGMGIIPHSEMARRFRDFAGSLNQEVARIADRVILLVSGIPIAVKGGAMQDGSTEGDA